jgi:Pentapeptide repeats (8 copies)
MEADQVNLNRAIMGDADLSYADLGWANIGNVDFSGVNLKSAKRQDNGGFIRDGEILQGAIRLYSG